ncbi:DeoR/GlpR family DNA-binding transcription regulator [Corynebacterium sp.]|uniref:DeoR/GlpR family DNA-binding transcription regulator n=1 Tax=Corynebacterium sp. TaxID=1720 RepID=UPI0028A8B635|nr:DeoR/GlpR family DNA-binding transcription regulator [Corynebacterium sp.]
MIRSDRLQGILDVLADQGSVSVDQIVADFEVSPATARRDLDELAAQGQLRRTRGGASSGVVSFDPPLWEKRRIQARNKRAIAEYCLSFIEPGSVIGLTGGSTVGALAEEFAGWAADTAAAEGPTNRPILTVVTNAVDIAYGLSGSPNIRVIVVGGVLNSSSRELTGPFGTSTLRQIFLDVAFLGVNGFDEHGPGVVDEYESEINGIMAAQASRPVIIADASKFGRRSFSSVRGLNIEKTTVVTDDSLPTDIVEKLAQRGYDVRQAPLNPEE